MLRLQLLPCGKCQLPLSISNIFSLNNLRRSCQRADSTDAQKIGSVIGQIVQIDCNLYSVRVPNYCQLSRGERRGHVGASKYRQASGEYLRRRRYDEFEGSKRVSRR